MGSLLYTVHSSQQVSVDWTVQLVQNMGMVDGWKRPPDEDADCCHLDNDIGRQRGDSPRRCCRNPQILRQIEIELLIKCGDGSVLCRILLYGTPLCGVSVTFLARDMLPSIRGPQLASWFGTLTTKGVMLFVDAVLRWVYSRSWISKVFLAWLIDQLQPLL